MRPFILALFLSGCAFEAEPELTCSWPPVTSGIPACLCSGRQPHDSAEARSVCCAAEDVPANVCQKTPPVPPATP